MRRLLRQLRFRRALWGGRGALLGAGLAALALLPSGCGYPEAGFYELVLYAPEADASASTDGSAGPAVQARLPFMVEELTDDTDLTTGFVLLLPRAGQLVRVPLQNRADTSRRGWSLAVAEADSGAGDLELSLEHYGEKLNLSGRYRALPGAPVQGFEGAMPEEGLLLLAAPVTAQLAGAPRLCAMAEVLPLKQSEFEARLGGKVKTAKRVEAARLEPLPEPAPPAAAPKPKESPPRRPRPMGGRSGSGR